jgi:4-amino-4-deoxy-L-arabinose transferase-like glycosyltransferase
MSMQAHITRWSRLRSWRPEARPWWSWAGLGALAILALVLFTWGLSRNGMGNEYYAAAIKSGSVSWKAWFFGALDPGSFITVDKLPASLWLEGLSARMFGFSSWSMLLPQALAGVGSVLILYHVVRRWQGDVAGLLAGLGFALTPVAVVMFRFNNPDALLTLLLLAAAWALWSALEKGSIWKLVASGALVGFAFLTKMLEAFVVLPAFAGVYLVCGPRRIGRRLLQLLAAAGALVLSAGWWVAAVELWPAASRPYVGGSSNNSVLDLVFTRSAGYLGNQAGGPNFSGTPGWWRIFNEQLGGQIAWLVPLALAGLVAGLWLTRRGRRTDLGRAGYLLWGAWALLLVLVFSFANGVLHPYYAVILAPALAALAGGGSVAMWRLGRQHLWLAWLLPAAVMATAFLAAWVLGRTPGYAPGLSTGIVVAGGVAAVALALRLARVFKARMAALAAGAVAIACVLAAPTAYSLSTVSHSVTGSFATAGPSSATQIAGGPGSGFGGGPGGFGGASSGVQTAVQTGVATTSSLVSYLLANKGSAEYLVAVQGAQSAEPFILATGEPVIAMGGFNGSDPSPTLAQFQQLVTEKRVRYVLVGGRAFGGPPMLASASSSSATSSSSVAETGGPPGGFPSDGGFGGGPGGFGGGSSAITQWVAQNATAVDASEYGGATSDGTLYQLW